MPISAGHLGWHPEPMVYLSASTDAVDAALITKDVALRLVATELGTPLKDVAAIGDSANDLPFLTIPGLGLCGAPANAQPIVKQTLRELTNNVDLEGAVLEGFWQFYAIAQRKGLSHVFADRDGVLTWKDTSDESLVELSRLFATMGSQGRPFLFILTGTSFQQNRPFMQRAGLNAALSSNPAVRRHPFILLAENGGVRVNVLTGETERWQQLYDDGLLQQLKGPFAARVAERLEVQVFPRFGLGWAHDATDQVERVYRPPKEAMVTFNVPRAAHDGSDYRRSSVSEDLRRAVLEVMVEVAESLGLRYRLLNSPRET